MTGIQKAEFSKVHATPLLVEIGCEEIPAGVAPRMARALRDALQQCLRQAGMEVALGWGATPRRLIVHGEHCPQMQPDREEEVWGPPERVAYVNGEPTKAALGFARKVQMPLAAFSLVEKGDQGRYMRAVRTIKGRPVTEILAGALPDLLRSLPSPKRMRWQDGDAREDTFIRPIRWIVARLGDEPINFVYAGVRSGFRSRGHRIHGAEGFIDVKNPWQWLNDQGVMADWNLRRQYILDGLQAQAKNQGVELVTDDELLDEVTDLTEWPEIVPSKYDEKFLKLPEEVSRIVLKQHQRCFAARQPNGSMSSVFFAVANLRSLQPEIVARGNARVVNARLSDAMFYFERDPQKTLEDRVELLSQVVFQDGLGMVGDQVRRLRGFVLDNASRLGVDPNDAQRAAYLCKSDLTTGLVYEFPELQGYMGGVYARMDGENEAVARGIAEHYLPAGAEDHLPTSRIARAIGIAERADKLLGYFHLGLQPSASADPYGLRRAAIGLVRLLAEESMAVDMSLNEVLNEAAKQWNQQRVTIAVDEQTCGAVRSFILDRFLGMAEAMGVEPRALDAALHASRELPLYRHLGVARLLSDFGRSETGQAVAAANKRVANLLKKAHASVEEVREEWLQEPAELRLFAELLETEEHWADDPENQLQQLAGLRDAIDVFFDEVMVMDKDERIRSNRLALLGRLRQLFLRLADVSRL